MEIGHNMRNDTMFGDFCEYTKTHNKKPFICLPLLSCFLEQASWN